MGGARPAALQGMRRRARSPPCPAAFLQVYYGTPSNHEIKGVWCHPCYQVRPARAQRAPFTPGWRCVRCAPTQRAPGGTPSLAARGLRVPARARTGDLPANPPISLPPPLAHPGQDIKAETVPLDGFNIRKAELEKRKNDDEVGRAALRATSASPPPGSAPGQGADRRMRSCLLLPEAACASPVSAHCPPGSPAGGGGLGAVRPMRGLGAPDLRPVQQGPQRPEPRLPLPLLPAGR